MAFQPKAYFLKHRLGCVFAALFLFAGAVLWIVNPGVDRLRASIPEDFISATGPRYALAESNLLVVSAARGRNVNTGEARTFIGFAGRIRQAEGSKALKSVADIILWVPSLIDGSKITISLTIASVTVGLFLSVFLALGKISKFGLLSKICGGYIFFFRGTPLLMQLFFVYYGLPYISPALTINDKFTAAFITFALNGAAYCAEIIRAAIQSIDKGQAEASHALGFSYAQTMRLVIIPQSFRRLIPPVANEFIMVLKDASLVAVIALMDLTRAAQQISSSSASVLVYIPAAVIYLIITAFFTFIFNRLEKKFSVHL